MFQIHITSAIVSIYTKQYVNDEFIKNNNITTKKIFNIKRTIIRYIDKLISK
jgi:hypothetical protein